VVIAILAVLSVVVVLVINPAELLAQGRDTTRLSGLASLNTAIALLQVDLPGAFLGTTSMVYVSIPDTSATCANLGLPTLRAGLSYACVSTSTYRRVDGTGWVPIDLADHSSGAPLAILPVDPVNTTTTGDYLVYVTDGSEKWELNAQLESTKYGYATTSAAKPTVDGGNNDYLYEVGNDLGLFLDTANFVLDGDMEALGVLNWSDYNTPTVKVKVTDTYASGERSMRLVTNGASYSGTMQGLTSFIPPSGRVFIQMSYKVAPGKTFGWECNCRSGACCWYFLFNDGTDTEWTRKTTVRDITAGALTGAYFSQPNAVASEFWIDDIIIRPIY
jgi:hypothetical protein